MAGVKESSSNKATPRGKEAGVWQRVVMGLAGLLMLLLFGVGFNTWGELSLDYYTGA